MRATEGMPLNSRHAYVTCIPSGTLYDRRIWRQAPEG